MDGTGRIGFRIYYDGGATYSGDPFNAPGLGVLVIVEHDPEHGRRLITGGDYYVWRDGRWWQADFMGLLDYLLQPGPRKVLVGRMVSNADYAAAYTSADTDADFAPRTAWGAYERRLTI